MLSWKRLLYVLLLVTVVSCIFIIYNINEERAEHIQIMNMQEEAKEFTRARHMEDSARPRVWLVGEDRAGEEAHDEAGGGILANVRQIFENLHYIIIEEAYLDPERLGREELVVFCVDSVGSHTDLVKLEAFLARGGKAVLAAGLPEGSEDSYLWPVLGIREKSIRDNYNRLRFEEAFWPVQAEEMVYEGYNLCTWLAVDREAKVYIRDAESNVPVLYTMDYGEGRIGLVNGTFLSDIRCAGLLTGMVGALEGDFLYPVLGVKTVFLDNFPMITFLNDKACMRMYGCSTESFVRDVVWPAFQGMSLRTRTPYTSSVLAAASSEDSFPEINDSLFATIGKSALQFDGELVYAVNCKDTGDIFYNQGFIEEFRSVFVKYEIRGLAMQAGRFREELLAIPGTQIRAVRTSLDGEKAGFSCDKEYLEFPAATRGNSLEEGNLFSIASVLGAYGMVSHVFDINTLIAEDEGTASWDSDKEQIARFETDVLNRTPWLEGRVLSRTGDDLKSYLGLSYAWNREGDTIEIDCSNIILGQAFFFRTEGEIREAEGLDYEKAGENYYLLRLRQNHAVITMKDSR